MDVGRCRSAPSQASDVSFMFFSVEMDLVYFHLVALAVGQAWQPYGKNPHLLHFHSSCLV